MSEKDIAKLKAKKQALKSKLSAYNIVVWRIPENRVNTIEKIGAGGWGEVCKGTVDVAIKKLHEEIVTPRSIERMERELKLLAEVQHPNLVQVVGAIFEGGAPRIVIELLDTNLRVAYQEKKLWEGNRLSIFKDIARALDYLHQRYEPIIHRDVSAPNVLLQEMPNHQWKGKVSDLGSANFLQHARTAAEGAIIYSPPEVIPQTYSFDTVPPPQTVKIDVFSFGIVMAEVTISLIPENLREILPQLQREHPALYQLIDQCIKRDPTDRPKMAEVLVELNKMAPF